MARVRLLLLMLKVRPVGQYSCWRSVQDWATRQWGVKQAVLQDAEGCAGRPCRAVKFWFVLQAGRTGVCCDEMMVAGVPVVGSGGRQRPHDSLTSCCPITCNSLYWPKLYHLLLLPLCPGAHSLEYCFNCLFPCLLLYCLPTTALACRAT
jgi:hypothetical protein